MIGMPELNANVCLLFKILPKLYFNNNENLFWNSLTQIKLPK